MSLSRSLQQKIHLHTPVPEPLPIWPIKVTTVNLLDDFTEDNGALLVAKSRCLSFGISTETRKYR